MELQYKEWLRVIGIRKKQIEDIALQDEKYNAEYVNLTEIEKHIRFILKEKI